MVRLLKKYRIFLVLVVANLLLLIFSPPLGWASISISSDSLREVLITLPPIFILLGLLEVWVPRETMIKLLGEGSGLTGMGIAFLLGSVAAGPLYAAFPIAGILLKKGGKFSNVLIFIGAWSTTKIPLLMFEALSMGWRFMIARFFIDIPGILLIAFLTERMISAKEKKTIYEKANALQ